MWSKTLTCCSILADFVLTLVGSQQFDTNSGIRATLGKFTLSPSFFSILYLNFTLFKQGRKVWFFALVNLSIVTKLIDRSIVFELLLLKLLILTCLWTRTPISLCRLAIGPQKHWLTFLTILNDTIFYGLCLLLFLPAIPPSIVLSTQLLALLIKIYARGNFWAPLDFNNSNKVYKFHPDKSKYLNGFDQRNIGTTTERRGARWLPVEFARFLRLIRFNFEKLEAIFYQFVVWSMVFLVRRLIEKSNF